MTLEECREAVGKLVEFNPTAVKGRGSFLATIARVDDDRVWVRWDHSSVLSFIYTSELAKVSLVRMA